MSLLLTGKVSIEYVDQIKYLIQKKFAIPSKHISDSFSSPFNQTGSEVGLGDLPRRTKDSGTCLASARAAAAVTPVAPPATRSTSPGAIRKCLSAFSA